MSETITYEGMPRSRRMIATVAIFLALAEILFFNAMARTVGTYITADLGDVNLYTLMNTIFFLCSTLAMPISCKLGDIFGRRNLIMAGIAIYSVSMLLAGLSTNMLMHVIFRGGQGLGEAARHIGQAAGLDKGGHLRGGEENVHNRAPFRKMWGADGNRFTGDRGHGERPHGPGLSTRSRPCRWPGDRSRGP